MSRLAAGFALLLLVACDDASETFYGYSEGHTISIASEYAGRIESILVKDGDKVAASEVLFSIDSEIFEADLKAAQAKTEAARARVARLRAAKQSDAMIKALDARIKGARLQLATQERNLERTKKLVKDQVVGEAALDGALNAYDQAGALFADLQAQRIEAAAPSRKSEIAAAEAEEKSAKAYLDAAQKRLKRAKIVAPMAAEVMQVLRRKGEVVGPGAPVMRLVESDYREAVFYLPQPLVTSFAVGDKFDVFCDGCKYTLKGELVFIAHEPEYTPPVIYSTAERSDLVFKARAILSSEDGRMPPLGQPLELRRGRE